jgi:hypothetical protein
VARLDSLTTYLLLPCLMGVIGLGVGLMNRSPLLGLLIGLLAVVLMGNRPLAFLAPWIITYAVIGLAGSSLGWAFRNKNVRLSVVSALWLVVTVELLHMGSLMFKVHDQIEVTFAVTLIATTVVLGTVTALVVSGPSKP